MDSKVIDDALSIAVKSDNPTIIELLEKLVMTTKLVHANEFGGDSHIVLFPPKSYVRELIDISYEIPDTSVQIALDNFADVAHKRYRKFFSQG